MASRVDAALEPLGWPPGAVRVKTFHALGREILADGGESVEPLLDREAVLRDIWPDITRGAIRRLDDAFSRLKLDIGVTAAEVGDRPGAGADRPRLPGVRAALEDAGGLDFDDLVGRSLRLLEARPRAAPPLARAAASTCWSTRRRTSTAASSGWRCCWRRRRTGSSSSATTTRRSTAGAWPTCGGCSRWPMRCRACAGST